MTATRFIFSLVILMLALAAAPLTAQAQPVGKVYRVGYLGTAHGSNTWDAFLQGLREHGWVEGHNIVFERRLSEGRTERFPALAAELVQLKVDIIVATGAAVQGVQAALEAGATIPIVMVAAADPVADKLVTSLARPGGYVTGLALVVSGDIDGKRLELLKEVAPKISRVAVLSGPPPRRELENAAKALRVALVPALADTSDRFPEALALITRERPSALIVRETGLNFRHRQLIVDFAASKRLPAIYGWREFADAGGLMSYGAHLADLFYRAAGYVDKILKGTRPGNLPVEQPRKFELVINLKTSKALGLTIPPSVLVRADEVIR